MSQATKRTLLFYAKRVQLYVLLAIGGSLVLGVYFSFLNEDTFGNLYESIKNAIWLIPYFIIVDNTAWGFYSISYYDSIALSFSARRKDLFLGEILWQILLVLECTVAEMILLIFFDTLETLPAFIGYCAISLVVGVVCRFLSAIQTKYGRAIYMVVLIGISISGGLVGALAMFMPLGTIFSSTIIPLSTIFALILFVVLTVLNKRTYNKIMVR